MRRGATTLTHKREAYASDVEAPGALKHALPHAATTMLATSVDRRSVLRQRRLARAPHRLGIAGLMVVVLYLMVSVGSPLSSRSRASPDTGAAAAATATAGRCRRLSPACGAPQRIILNRPAFIGRLQPGAAVCTRLAARGAAGGRHRRPSLWSRSPPSPSSCAIGGRPSCGGSRRWRCRPLGTVHRLFVFCAHPSRGTPSAGAPGTTSPPSSTPPSAISASTRCRSTSTLAHAARLPGTRSSRDAADASSRLYFDESFDMTTEAAQLHVIGVQRAALLARLRNFPSVECPMYSYRDYLVKQGQTFRRRQASPQDYWNTGRYALAVLGPRRPPPGQVVCIRYSSMNSAMDYIKLMEGFTWWEDIVTAQRLRRQRRRGVSVHGPVHHDGHPGQPPLLRHQLDADLFLLASSSSSSCSATFSSRFSRLRASSSSSSSCSVSPSPARRPWASSRRRALHPRRDVGRLCRARRRGLCTRAAPSRQS